MKRSSLVLLVIVAAVSFLVGALWHPFSWRASPKDVARYGGTLPMHANDGSKVGEIDGHSGACLDLDGGVLDCKEFNLRMIYGRAAPRR